jgi:hypothetical protein
MQAFFTVSVKLDVRQQPTSGALTGHLLGALLDTLEDAL